MTRDELINSYFEWMYQLVCNDEYSKSQSYRKLLYFLHDAEFFYDLPMDGNRACDGENLRYRFGRECGYSDPMIAECLDDRPCSVLEMMVALVIRCEEHIMEDDDEGDRTGQWFWEMIVNLGLGSMNDRKFDIHYVDRCIKRFLNRNYKRNGEGGLFTVNNGQDLRNVEIWYQMHWHLNDILES